MALEDFSKYTKITVNPALPKNEKDLICALLAGRLRNLFNGRLFCLDLAIGDLVKDASGYGLSDLVSGLKGLQGSLNDFKNEVGYDKILGSINQALGGIGTVFSLGGLCPSPIRPPQIPDIMPMVNAQLFGQGMNIINALGKVANPKMCFGGGPGGFGVNYNSMPGALSQLKNALARAANDPAGLKSISKAFENNIKMQERRLKAEVNRLQTNLADPFGIQQAKQTAAALKSANNRGADYKVVDSKGIQHPNAIKSLVPSDTLALLNVTDVTPILYKREAVLDYCGEEVGIKIVPVSGDLAYAGWDTNPAADNTIRPFGQHILPVADYAYYDFVVVEQNNAISAYKYNIDTKNLEAVRSINLERGIAYRFKISLITKRMAIVDPNNSNEVWSNGIEFGYQGSAGHEVIEVASGLKSGELDWSVLIENPTTPNSLSLSFNSTTIPVNITGKTSIPAAERTYNLSDIVNKAVLFSEEKTVENASVLKKKWNRIYTLKISGQSTGTPFSKELDIRYNPKKDDSYAYINDPDSTDSLDKILKTKTTLNGNPHSQNLYVNELTGVSLSKLVLQFGNNFASMVFDSPVVITTDTKLPYTIEYSYRQAIFNTPNVFHDKMEFLLLDDKTIRFYLTSQRLDSYTSGRFLQYYDIDITDLSKPMLKSSYTKFSQGKTTFESSMTFKEEFTAIPLSATATNVSVQEGSSVNSKPVTPAGGLDPYSFNISPALPTGLTLNSDTGYITGTASSPMASTEYVVSITDALEDDTVVSKFNLAITARPRVAAPMFGSGFVTGGGSSNILGDPDPALFVQQPNGSWMPRVDAVPGKDYTYTEFTPGIYTLVNLNSYQPTAVNNQPIADGNGITRTWNVNGTTFQTSQQYAIEQTNPPLNAYNQLPVEQRLQLIGEYSADKNFSGMTNAGPDYINSYESQQFKDFLTSKGLG